MIQNYSKQQIFIFVKIKSFRKKMIQSETEIYQFTLNILSVKMNVKFPCKMKLQHNNNGLTKEVSCNQSHKFTFNQQITLKEQKQKAYFQVTANLITQKGGKYIAGVLKLFQNQLSKSEGQRIIIPLAKCLDTEAYCQLRVDQVHVSKHMKKINGGLFRSRANVQFQHQYASGHKPLKPTFIGTQTKSQYHVGGYKKKQFEDIRTKTNRNYNKDFQRSPQKSPIKLRNINQIRHENHYKIDFPQFTEIDRDKFIEAEVYKEGYNKLKQKYKKQAENAKNQFSRRITLESSENNLKVEIMRLKLKNQQNQKLVNEKNIKIKQLQTQNNIYQKKELDMSYMKQQINNKQHSLRIVQQNLKTLARDNEQLKIINSQLISSQKQKTKQLKRQIEQLRQKTQLKELELQKDIKSKLQVLFQKQYEIQTKNQIISREKRAIDQLERQAQNRILEFEKLLQTEKLNSKSKIEELKNKVQRAEKNCIILQNQKSDLEGDIQRIKTLQIKAQYQNKVLSQQNDTAKSQLINMKMYKEKYSEIFRDHKLLLDDKNHLQKQLQRALQSKQLSQSQLTKQYNEQIEYLRKTNKDLDEKQRNFSNKCVQLQGLLQASKAIQQKLKRNIQGLNNELIQCKQRQKNTKKSLKLKQQQNLTFQNELTNLKQKYKSTEHFYKHQLDKYKQQLEKVKKQHEAEANKNVQTSQYNGQLNVELGKIKVKLQFAQQKLQKDIIDIKQKKQQIQTIVKDYQVQLTSLNDIITQLRNCEKQLITKLQKQQIEMLKNQDQIDRLNKEIRVWQEKYGHTENLLKTRQSQSSVLQTGKKDLQHRSIKLQQQLSQMRNQINQLSAQKTKNIKMIDLLQQENNKIRKDNEKIKKIIEEKDKINEQLSSDIKKLKEDLTKSEIKLNSTSKDFQRFKQSVMDVLNSAFTQVLPQRKDRQQQYSLIQYGSRKNLINQSNIGTTTSDINNLILNYSKQTKIALNKLNQQNRNLTRQVQKLQQQLTGNINRGQTSQYNYSKQIQDLQSQLSHIFAQKEQDTIKYEHLMKQLNNKLRQKDKQINELNNEINDLAFANNNIKLQYENQTEMNNKKSAILKNKILQLQQKGQFLNMTLMNSQEKNYQLQGQVQILRSTIKGEKQFATKKDRIVIELQEKREQLEEEIQQGKRHRKDLLQKSATLELLLNTQRQQSQKIRQLLEDQQQKTLQLKTFIGSLMKQKQSIIKSQLQKSQQIISLEGKGLQLTRDRDILAQQLKQVQKHLEQFKQSNRKIIFQIKELETKYSDQKNKNNKLSDKLKQKQKQVLNKQQIIEKIQAKCLRLNQRGQKQGAELREELQSKTEELIKITKQYGENTFKFDKEKHLLQTTITQLKNQIMHLQEEVFNMKHSHDTRLEQISTLNRQLEEYKIKIQSMKLANQELNEQIRQQQQNSYQLSGKTYNLQMKIQAKQMEKNQKITALDNDWICKYQGMCEQYEQRIQLVAKQRDYYRLRMSDHEDQVKKIVNEKSKSEVEDVKMRNILEDKIKHLEEQRLLVISQKNTELQKINEQNKTHFETIKLKQSQLRKISHEMQICKTNLTKMDIKNKQFQEKIKSITKIHQNQIEQLRKKITTQKNFKELISTKIWNSEREVRKILQNFSKKLIETCQDTKYTYKMLDVMKGFEQNITDAIKIQIDDIN